MCEQEATFPADASLAMYVGFASAVDLDEEEWWEGFPEQLQLSHALAVCTVLQGRV